MYNTNKYNTSGYAVDSTYKATYKIDDPIIIFNTDPYHRVETRDAIGGGAGVSTYE